MGKGQSMEVEGENFIVISEIKFYLKLIVAHQNMIIFDPPKL